MKKVIYFIVFILFASYSANAQQMRHHRGPGDKGDARAKIEELEKIKLLEALKLDEPTMLKFFSRRDQYQAKVKQLNESAEDVLHQMEKEIGQDATSNSPELKKLVDQYLDIQSKIGKSRSEFIQSVSDILSYDQICKYLVFERKFREEIRNLLFKDRFKFRDEKK